MNRPRASRLSQPSPGKRGFLTDRLPYGSIQRKILFRVVVPIVSLIVLIGIVDKLVMPTVTRLGTEFPLRDFTGMTLTETEISLEELDLRWAISSEEYSPGKEAGLILNQFPVSGTMVKSGRTIKFVLSLGKKMIPIPDVAGKSHRQAMLDLEAVGLKLGEISLAFSDTIPERVVVFSYPVAGTEVPLGSPVNLMVNRGRASTFTYMPNLIGLPLSEAVKKLDDKSLQLGITSHRTDDNYLPETVLEQSEPEGTELDVGTEIDLVVSST